MTTNSVLQVLSPGVGYGIVIGIGGVFAVLMLCVTWLQNRYTSFSSHESEEFNTASRNIKPGLIASGIVSSWTWSTTLLTSSTFSYKYGVCGGMWYAANGCLQIMLFSLIAIKIKSNTPGAHTFAEIILSKHGKIAHVTYLIRPLNRPPNFTRQGSPDAKRSVDLALLVGELTRPRPSRPAVRRLCRQI
ncbi:hypothetical protein Vi05172_g6661 [Venturia inaequalis]|nr:hypothetical protein Vi05172_g6661 [Venturia inaequalis]